MLTQPKTKKDLIDEIIKCGRDPIYFIDSYAKIQHPTRGLVPFKTFGYQHDTLNAFVNHRFNIVLKARQLGFTTVTAAFIAWFILFRKDRNVLIVSTKSEVAKNTIRIIRTILSHLPKQMMLCKIDIDNRLSVELTNGSRVKAITTSADAGRSESPSLLFIDEAAHIDKMEELWTGLFPVVSAGGRIIASSTPNGTSNWFYRTYKQAQNFENTFNCRYGVYVNPSDPTEQYNDRFMWWVHPEHDERWFEEQTANDTLASIAQEHLCAFNASGDTFLPGHVISNMERLCREPIDRQYNDNNLWIWDYPRPNAQYIIACDVSSGFAKDFSAFHVLRIDAHLEQVAEYKGKITPDILGELLLSVAKKYNNATIAPENNSGWSGQTIQKLTEANYPHLYWMTRKNNVIDAYSATSSGTTFPGYSITSSNRIQMLSKMEQYIRKEDIKIYSSRLVDEFREFIWFNQRPQAARSANDDLIMSLAGAIWIRDESFACGYKQADMTKALIDATGFSQNQVKDHTTFNLGEEAQQRRPQLTMSDGSPIPLHFLISG